MRAPQNQTPHRTKTLSHSIRILERFSALINNIRAAEISHQFQQWTRQNGSFTKKPTEWLVWSWKVIKQRFGLHNELAYKSNKLNPWQICCRFSNIHECLPQKRGIFHMYVQHHQSFQHYLPQQESADDTGYAIQAHAPGKKTLRMPCHMSKIY